MQIKDRIKSLVRVRAGDLFPNSKNWRVHTEEQEHVLRSLVSQLGFVDAVLVREIPQGYELIDGHLRASIEPDTFIPALVLDVDQKEADLILASFDPVASLAGTDAEKFADLINTLEEQSDAVEQMFREISEQSGSYDVDEDEFPTMTSDEKTHEQMTFTVTIEQAEVVKKALQASTDMGPFPEDGNRNGLALARICEVFLGTM